MHNIILFGPPGAGKGTQSAKLIDKYAFTHLSTGDIFRAIKKSESDLAMEVRGYMDKGNLVPDELTIRVLEAEVNIHIHPVGFIFDGFPRTDSQARALDLFLAEKGETINGMVALEVPENVLVTRLLERGKISGRPDDQDEEKIRNRFNEYDTKTAVLKDYYTAQGIYFGVDGVGSIEDITNRLKVVVEQL